MQARYRAAPRPDDEIGLGPGIPDFGATGATRDPDLSSPNWQEHIIVSFDKSCNKMTFDLDYAKMVTLGVAMPDMIEVQIDSVRVHLMTPQRLVVLKQLDSERYLPIWVGPYEAEAITIALQEVDFQVRRSGFRSQLGNWAIRLR